MIDVSGWRKRQLALDEKAQLGLGYGCAECGADGGHALYCVACAEKYVAPQRTWVGLTEEEILKFQDIVPNTLGYDLIQFAKAIEAKLKERNI